MNYSIALARKRILKLQTIFGRSSIKFLMNLLFDGRYTLSSSDSLLETMLGFIPFMIQREKMKRLNFLTAHAQQLFRQVLFRCAIFLLLETLDLWSFCGRWDHHCVDTSCSRKKTSEQRVLEAARCLDE